MLGYGFSTLDLEKGLEIALQSGSPTAIILDSGSTDSGPAKLALGSMTCPRSSYERDLRQLICAVKKYRVPLLISSAGGDGSDAHVKEFLDIIRETLEAPDQRSLKTLAVYSGARHELLLEKLVAGKITGCGTCVPKLTEQDIMQSPCIVGQIGPEPFVQAMNAHSDFDILIAGRAYDPSPYVAFCAFNALRESTGDMYSLESTVLGGFTHMGKLMECGGACATPKSASSMATVYSDGSFDIRPLAAESRCTPTSVAAHALYEKSRPDILHGPGGFLDLNTATYTSLSDGISVRTYGSEFVSSKSQGLPITIKFEAARVIGYRGIFMGSFCDPILIRQLPSLLDRAKAYVKQKHAHTREKWEVDFHVYGFDLDRNERTSTGDVFIVGEALAETQALANSVTSSARIACVHAPYEGQKANGGNFGMGIGGKLEVEMGACAEFSIYHLAEMEEGEEEAIEISQDATGRRDQGNGSKSLTRWETRLLGSGPRIDRQRFHDSSTHGGCGANHTINPTTISSHPKPLGQITGTFTLGEIAKVIRSKNAGPFEITLDVMFDCAVVYQQVKEAGVLATAKIAELYDISVDSIVWCGFFDQALAFKATIPRYRNGKPNASGGFMENDVHGSQNHLPLFNITITLRKQV
ncbi:hypothetical protein N7478_012105 [Penicillium angulare]|uniref:uncharacterized protein n=1 Tax=Penicillium angulare TaxID=116970 RepID=UPI002540DE04|nr:uncharacterized protein N7478_012105 [Penicillium angulare]KAJ5260500.1 hypothetical protein N7478_012105 [Penicillium angulare]